MKQPKSKQAGFSILELLITMTIMLSLVGLSTLAALPFIKGGVIGALRATSQKKAA